MGQLLGYLNYMCFDRKIFIYIDEVIINYYYGWWKISTKTTDLNFIGFTMGESYSIYNK